MTTYCCKMWSIRHRTFKSDTVNNTTVITVSNYRTQEKLALRLTNVLYPDLLRTRIQLINFHLGYYTLNDTMRIETSLNFTNIVVILTDYQRIWWSWRCLLFCKYKSFRRSSLLMFSTYPLRWKLKYFYDFHLMCLRNEVPSLTYPFFYDCLSLLLFRFV